jgi:DNA methylase
LTDAPQSAGLVALTERIELWAGSAARLSKSRDIVLDCFAGAGSTLIACAKAGRQARLVELDPKYCDVIVQRWQAWSGEVATLQGGGQSFDGITKERCVGKGPEARRMSFLDLDGSQTAVSS